MIDTFLKKLSHFEKTGSILEIFILLGNSINKFLSKLEVFSTFDSGVCPPSTKERLPGKKREKKLRDLYKSMNYIHRFSHAPDNSTFPDNSVKTVHLFHS